MYYAGLPYAGGQQPILLDLLGSKEGDKAKKSGKGGKVKKSGKGDKVEKTDISDSCGLFLEILPLIRAIALGFLGDTLDDYDFVLAAFAKEGRGISKSFGTIDYETWVQEYAVASQDKTCNAKVSNKAAFFNVVLVLQLFGAVFGEKCEGGGFKRMLNLPLHTDNLHSLYAAPCYAWNNSQANDSFGTLRRRRVGSCICILRHGRLLLKVERMWFEFKMHYAQLGLASVVVF